MSWWHQRQPLSSKRDTMARASTTGTLANTPSLGPRIRSPAHQVCCQPHQMWTDQRTLHHKRESICKQQHSDSGLNALITNVLHQLLYNHDPAYGQQILLGLHDHRLHLPYDMALPHVYGASAWVWRFRTHREDFGEYFRNNVEEIIFNQLDQLREPII